MIYVAFGPMGLEDQPSPNRIRYAEISEATLVSEIKEGGVGNIGYWVIRKYAHAWTQPTICQAICDVTKLEHDATDRYHLKEVGGKMRHVPGGSQ